jgi:hypothetical protein
MASYKLEPERPRSEESTRRMFVDDAKAAKKALNERIALALREFSRDTGLKVADLRLEHEVCLGAPQKYIVHSEVHL